MTVDIAFNAISNMGVKYEGLCADHHLLNAFEYSKSVDGVAKLYRLVTHYCIHGEVLKPREKTDLTCYAYPAKTGSFDSVFAIISGASAEIPIFADIYKPAVNWVVSKIMGYLKESLTKGEKGGENKVDGLVNALKERAEKDAEVNLVIAQGIVKSNNDLIGLNEKLIDTLPVLINLARTPYGNAVLPVGKSCSSMAQFTELEEPVNVSIAEAEAIRSKGEIVLGSAEEILVKRIHSLNVDSGATTLEIEGVDGIISGKVDDRCLSIPNNPYSKALNLHTSIKVRGRKAFNGDSVCKIFLTEAV